MPISERAQALWAQVQENRKRLDACVGPHVFTPVSWIDEKHLVVRDEACGLCGGVLGAHEVAWYRRGLAHGTLAGERARGA